MPMHSAEPVHATSGERAMVKTQAHWPTEMAVIRMEIVEVVKVVEAIDKDKAHARANENRRPPPPGTGIGIGLDRIPQHGTIRVLHDLPGPVSLLAGTSDDLLHRAIDFCLPDNGLAIRAAGRCRRLVIHLRECRRSKAEADEQGPKTKQVVHDE